jgi:uncharacterized membrane protein
VSEVVKGIEGVGAGIMVLGGIFALGRYARRALAHTPEAYKELRESLGRAILIGLEVLIIADIIRTIIVDQSLESVAILGLIVAIRIALSFSLDVEIDGVWPWNRWRTGPGDQHARGRQ